MITNICHCCGSQNVVDSDNTFPRQECTDCGSSWSATALPGLHEHSDYSNPDRVRKGPCNQQVTEKRTVVADGVSWTLADVSNTPLVDTSVDTSVVPNDLDNIAGLLPGRPLFVKLSGSRSYNIALPTSDRDYTAVWVAPLSDFYHEMYEAALKRCAELVPDRL